MQLPPHTPMDLENLKLFMYFSEWRHLKTLLGTASTWFLLDTAFHRTNLNQSVLPADISFLAGKMHWDAVMRNAIGNLVITVSGNVSGYFLTIYFIEKLACRWIQIQGFLIAGGYGKLGTSGNSCASHLRNSSSTLNPMQRLSSHPPKYSPVE